MEQLKFESEIKNLSKTINELHNTLHQLVSVGNIPKKGELRLIRSKIKDSRVLLEFIQKELLKKDESYQKDSQILKQMYQEKKQKEELKNGQEES
jgi:hypothetical protein